MIVKGEVKKGAMIEGVDVNGKKVKGRIYVVRKSKGFVRIEDKKGNRFKIEIEEGKKKKRNKKKVKDEKKVTGKRTREAFGGYAISFKGCKASLEDVFGKKPIPPSQMTKLLWEYIREKGLGGKEKDKKKKNKKKK